MAVVPHFLFGVFLGGGIHSFFRSDDASGKGFRRMLPWTPFMGTALWAATAAIDAQPRIGSISGEAEHAVAIVLLTLAVVVGAWVDHLLNDERRRTADPPEGSGS